MLEKKGSICYNVIVKSIRKTQVLRIDMLKSGKT